MNLQELEKELEAEYQSYYKLLTLMGQLTAQRLYIATMSAEGKLDRRLSDFRGLEEKYREELKQKLDKLGEKGDELLAKLKDKV